ncbi:MULTISPECIES: DVUA0089 family protein [unclassified Yoonia]|uniref:DVUA0089 family protein n=1 Tax=unclassified Yoonia TaxID=2629118 RepID=UPI002AFF6D08|nr:MULTISPECIES: DVUA0089 family protein [unclassified Yoonia]
MTRTTIMKTTAICGALLGFAAPALAQVTCGGAGTGGQWIGGDEATSDIATADTYREQMALVLGGNDYVALFTLSEATDIRVEAAGRGAGDPMIDLLDEDGGIILSDDDSGGNAASRAETNLEPGSYCLAMRSYDGGPMTAFVRIGRQEHDPLTDGIMDDAEPAVTGSCADATPMGPLGSDVSGSAAETPYWSFTLDEPTPVTITAVNESADPVITLYDTAENYLGENDDYDGFNSRLDMATPLEAGTYCLNVRALSDDTLPITLNVSPYDAQAAMLDIYARGEAAPPLDGSVPVTDLGLINTRLRQDVTSSTDVDWFTVQVDSSSLLLIEAIGNGNVDPWLIVYDDLGREIGQNDDYGGSLDSLLAARVQPGDYLIGVRQYGDGQGLIRLVIERFVPAQ